MEIQTQQMRIESRRSAIIAELEEMRQATGRYTFIDKNGALKVRECQELTDLQNRIKEREQALERLEKSVHRIMAALKSANVDSIEALREKRDHLANEIQSGPVRAWDQFRLAHELPVANGGHPTLLPSDLTQIESYKAFEDAEREKMDSARKELETISPALEECVTLAVSASNA